VLLLQAILGRNVNYSLLVCLFIYLIATFLFCFYIDTQRICMAASLYSGIYHKSIIYLHSTLNLSTHYICNPPSLRPLKTLLYPLHMQLKAFGMISCNWCCDHCEDSYDSYISSQKSIRAFRRSVSMLSFVSMFR